MKRMLTLVLLSFLILPINALSQTINLKVKGIKIGSSYSNVLQKIGKPLSSKKGGIIPCDGGALLTMRYQGMIIKLSKDEKERNFTVYSIEVTSPKWSVSGINAGASLKTVQAKFGASKLTKDEGLDNLTYFITDGYSNFYFRNKKLVKVRWEFNFC